MMRKGVPFHLVCTNSNVNGEGSEGLNLAIPRFGEGSVGIAVGGRSGSRRKVKWCGWIISIKQGYAGGWFCMKGSGTHVHVQDGLSKARQGVGYV